jgi:two-component system cell cycle sensor histidine kinase/response regulator CckA
MPDGGRLLIATRAMRAERDRLGSAPSRVAISVTDTGVGMDEATRARIFEPFFTTKDHGKGTGLGLATVYGIVGQSGGTIHVTSEIGVGATFTITLAAASATGEMPAERGSLPVTWGIPNGPVRAALKPPALALVKPAPERDPGDTSYSPTILLAEDEPAVRSLVEHVLETAGFTVITAIDGREALDMAEDLGSIDLLLTDVMMPRINGPDLAAALREQRPDQRILFMSGFTDDVLGERGIIAPEVELLTKPFTPDELVARIQQVLAAPSVAVAAPSKGG